MGFFDRFRKRVQEVADETDFDELTAEEGTEEAQETPNPPSPDMIEVEAPDVEALETLSQHEEFARVRTHVPAYKTQPEFGDEDDDWDGTMSNQSGGIKRPAQRRFGLDNQRP